MQTQFGLVPNEIRLSHLEIPCPGKVLPVLVERDGHDPISGVECLLHSVTMVNINVNVENSLMIPGEGGREGGRGGREGGRERGGEEARGGEREGGREGGGRERKRREDGS